MHLAVGADVVDPRVGAGIGHEHQPFFSRYGYAIGHDDYLFNPEIISRWITVILTLAPLVGSGQVKNDFGDFGKVRLLPRILIWLKESGGCASFRFLI